MVWPKSLLDVCYTVALLYDGSSSSFVRLCCNSCHISAHFFKKALSKLVNFCVAFLVLKMEERQYFWHVVLYI